LHFAMNKSRPVESAGSAVAGDFATAMATCAGESGAGAAPVFGKPHAVRATVAKRIRQGSGSCFMGFEVDPSLRTMEAGG